MPGGKEQPRQVNSFRRCRGAHIGKLRQTEEQRLGLKANTQVQDQEHKVWLWQSGELLAFPVTAHYVRRPSMAQCDPLFLKESFQIRLFLLISQ